MTTTALPERPRMGTPPPAGRRLVLRRPRPLLVRLYAALLSDMGILGAPARRRGARFLGRSLPAAAVVALGALVPLRVFEVPLFGWPQIAAMAVLAVALGALVWRRVARAAAGEAAGYREQLELGAMFVVAAYVLAQSAAAGHGESPFQAVVYLVMAFLVAFLARWVGAALVGLAVALELLGWAAHGARGAELPDAVVRSGFVLVFAVLYHAVLAAQVAASRRDERLAIERRMKEIDQLARSFRLTVAAPDDAAARDERDRRWNEAAVIEIEAAVGGALEIAAAALRCHTCALFWLSDDGKELELYDCRSPSEAIAAEPFPAGEGNLGAVVKQKKPLRLHGDVKGASYYQDGTRPGALLAVPLVAGRGDFVRGVVVVDRLEPEPFGDADEHLLGTLAAEILRAVEAERVMKDVKQSDAETRRFYGAIERLNRTHKQAEVFDALVDVARGMVPVDLAAIVLREEGDDRRLRVVRVVAGEHVKDEHAKLALDGHAFTVEEGLVGSAVRMGATLPAAELDLARTPVFGAVGLKGLASLKIVPLKVGERSLGALVLGAIGRHAYRSDPVRQLEVVAMHAAQSLERAYLFDETERLATTDGLTGLVNHRTFQERLDAHLAQALRYGKKLSLIICDIDHFKSVNDTYGHPVGDQVLRGVARTLGKDARTTDVVARYGGEEFAIVMPETDTGGAMVIAERIRERVGQLQFESDQGPLRVTLSLGVATFPDDGKKKSELVERADGCLYHAKRHGRNQSVSAASLRAPRRIAG
ncbi:sensor domain-containing diguanylate cyclase [Anaeromyxobacter oryzisoli]|uniref:sensor domain-containing diguanylate cyclase n=1 Tax=Anaeromyxobacter oryzisoli TaxID=2925408 RepID=UPI001F58C7DF|nr:sensor domain-containing diguanylate cyclase [Anaeromyxobacter sp. SG63]